MPVINEYLSNAGFIGLGTEAAGAWGTPVASAEWVPFKTETLTSDPGIKNVPTIRGSRSENTVKYLGEYHVAGNIVVPVFPNQAMRLLAGALGKDAYATGTHTVSVSDGGLPSFTVEKNLGGLTSLQYAGCLVNKYDLKLATNAEAEATIDFVGKVDAQITPTTPTYLTENPYSLLEIGVAIDGAASGTVEMCDLSIDNGVKEKYFFNASRYSALNYGGTRKVSGKITMTLEDLTVYNKDMAGTTSSVVISLIQDATHECVITLPNVVWEKPNIPLKMGELVTIELPFMCYAFPGSTDISAVIKNDSTAVYF